MIAVGQTRWVEANRFALSDAVRSCRDVTVLRKIHALLSLS